MTVVHMRKLLYHKSYELIFDVQGVILSYPWLLKVKYGNCFVCLFVFKENHFSCDQQHCCEVILVTAEMKSIHLLMGLVRQNASECHLPQGF